MHPLFLRLSTQGLPRCEHALSHAFHCVCAMYVMCRDRADPVHVFTYDITPRVCHVCMHDCGFLLYALGGTERVLRRTLRCLRYQVGAQHLNNLKTFIRFKIGGL